MLVKEKGIFFVIQTVEKGFVSNAKNVILTHGLGRRWKRLNIYGMSGSKVVISFLVFLCFGGFCFGLGVVFAEWVDAGKRMMSKGENHEKIK